MKIPSKNGSKEFSLATVNGGNLSRSRKEHHEMAKQLLRSGEWKIALAALEEIQDQFGPNIAISADIAVCFYFLGRLPEWRRQRELVHADLGRYSLLLSPSRAASVKLLLTKFLEEEGEIAQAISLYKELIRSPYAQENSDFWRSIAAQLLRLGAHFSENLKLGIFHVALAALRDLPECAVNRLDIQHALLLSDAVLLGTEVCLKRLEKVELELSPAKAELGLIYFDLMDCLMAKGAGIPVVLLDRVKTCQPSNNYERCFLALILEGHQAASDAEAKILAPEADFSIGDQLRLSFYLQQYQCDGMNSLSGKLALLLESLSAGSKRLWLKAYKMNGSRSNEIKLGWRESYFYVNEQKIDLRSKPLIRRLLRSLMAKRVCTVDALAKALWNREGDELHFHRLRALISRVNAIGSRVGVPQLILLEGRRVMLQNFSQGDSTNSGQ